MQLAELTQFLDGYLNHASMSDMSLNGLQIEAEGAEIKRVALAVDASLAAIEGAIAANAQLLITHHGLFWGRPVALSGMIGRRVRTMIQAGLSLYTSHLPLDAHAEVGNNAELARLLDYERVAPFGEYRGATIGWIAESSTPPALSDLLDRIQAAIGTPHAELRVWGTTNHLIRRLAIVSGGAASEIEAAIAAGCDAFLTGEPNYGAAFPAIERGVPLICAGHYHTETVGVQALGRVLTERFGLETLFIPAPIGI